MTCLDELDPPECPIMFEQPTKNTVKITDRIAIILFMVYSSFLRVSAYSLHVLAILDSLSFPSRGGAAPFASGDFYPDPLFLPPSHGPVPGKGIPWPWSGAICS